jgi:hypothetical protein
MARNLEAVSQLPTVTGTLQTPGDALADGERLKLALSIMEYNQGFVNFADGKANSLLLVNSIFLATAAARDVSSALVVAALVGAALAILLSLGVVYARLPGPMKRDRAKIVFWGHIHQRRSRTEFLSDFLEARPSEVLESLGKQIFDLSAVVDRKFKAYQLAQLATFLSAALWMANLLAPALRLLG